MTSLLRFKVVLLLLLGLVPPPASAQYAPLVYPGGSFGTRCSTATPGARIETPAGDICCGNTVSVAQGTIIYFSAVVAPRTRASFALVDEATGSVAYTHVTQPARSNCVVHREPEAFNTANLPVGRYRVYVSFWGHGAVVDQPLGTLIVEPYIPLCPIPPWVFEECYLYGGYWNWSRCSCEYPNLQPHAAGAG